MIEAGRELVLRFNTQPVAPTDLEQCRLLTWREVAQICQVCRPRAFVIMHGAGAVKLGRSLRVRPEDLAAYLRRVAVGEDGPRRESRHSWSPEIVSES